MMADDIPIIPKVDSLLIHTGNIVNWNRIKRQLSQTPAEELSESISLTIAGWLQTADKNDLQFATSIPCLNSKFVESLDPAERDAYKLTVKIYLCSVDEHSIKEALEGTMSKLGISSIETVLLSAPESHHTIDTLVPLWETLEGWVDSGKVFSLGTADLNKIELEALYARAKIKPVINQVNLESCCVMPPDLTEFARENSIQLLTHSDPRVMLSAPAFQKIVGKNLTPRDGYGWYPKWLVRYSVLIKTRGIIKAKGYIVSAARSTARHNGIDADVAGDDHEGQCR